MMIDYTTMRLGTRITRTRKIEKCPKCNRKGECYRLEIVPGKPFRLYTHKSENVGWATIGRDSCHVDGWADA